MAAVVNEGWRDMIVICALDRVPEHENDRVSSEEHFADLPVLVDLLRFLLALPRFGHFGPHLRHILQHHVAVTIECLDASEQLLVVATVDQHLSTQQAHTQQKQVHQTPRSTRDVIRLPTSTVRVGCPSISHRLHASLPADPIHAA